MLSESKGLHQCYHKHIYLPLCCYHCLICHVSVLLRVNSHGYATPMRLNGEAKMLAFPHYSVSNTVFSSLNHLKDFKSSAY